MKNKDKIIKQLEKIRDKFEQANPVYTEIQQVIDILKSENSDGDQSTQTVPPGGGPGNPPGGGSGGGGN